LTLKQYFKVISLHLVIKNIEINTFWIEMDELN
jgi:hypothetical protein